LQAQGYKGKPHDIFQSFAQMRKFKQELPDGMISVDNLKASFLFNKMVGAKGGEDIWQESKSQD
jgi:hypothetical protein